jgi:hypothetical protein
MYSGLPNIRGIASSAADTPLYCKRHLAGAVRRMEIPVVDTTCWLLVGDLAYTSRGINEAGNRWF